MCKEQHTLRAKPLLQYHCRERLLISTFNTISVPDKEDFPLAMALSGHLPGWEEESLVTLSLFEFEFDPLV